MGQPDGDYSDYNADQHNEYDQENHYDASQAQQDFAAYTFQQVSDDPTQQDPPMNPPPPNDPQNQQPQQPGQYRPPPPQPFQQQQRPPQFPAQPFQQPQQPPQYRPQQQYPPQMNAGYAPQQGRPAQYPPQNPQGSPMFGQQPQPGPQAYPPQAPPVQFPPPQSPLRQQVPYNNIPNSPIKPAAGFPVQITQQAYNQGWKTGLFDCMDDPMNALITAFFPCVTFGQVAEIVDNGNTSCGTSGMLYGLIAFCIAMPCIMSCSYRTKLRARFGLIESPAPDWVTHFFCEYCALCQEYRELTLRGIDPSIGWQGNVAMMQQPQVAMVAPPNQRMMP